MNIKFSYLIENLTHAIPTQIEMILGFIIGLFLIIGMRYFFLYAYGYGLLSVDIKEFKKKKDTLTDLILMKDIQTELEKEIEQAMLKATFQG